MVDFGAKQTCTGCGGVAELVRTLEAAQWKRIEEMAKHIELMPEEEREKLRKSIR
jgi:hypothetical protein